MYRSIVLFRNVGAFHRYLVCFAIQIDEGQGICSNYAEKCREKSVLDSPLYVSVNTAPPAIPLFATPAGKSKQAELRDV